MQNTEIEQKIAASYQKIYNQTRLALDLVLNALVTIINNEITLMRADLSKLQSAIEHKPE